MKISPATPLRQESLPLGFGGQAAETSRGRPEPAKLGLLLFIAIEIMFFAGLISAFLVFRLSPVEWPPAGQPRLPLEVTLVNTFVLLLSALSFQLAYRSLRGGSYLAFLGGLERAAILGGLFLIVQGMEWARLVGFGLTWSSGVFGGFFYSLVGLHGLHVLGGLLALLWMKGRASRGSYASGNILEVELCRIYWFFVTALWPVIFVLVYL